jgi:hypothetical protein
MATIITKNSSTASSVPAAGSLQQGELAVNVTDKKLFTKDSSGTVVGVGQEPLISGTNIKTVNGQSVLGSGNLSVGTGDVTLAGTQTLTNKTIAFGSNTVSGTKAQFNTAVTDDDFAYLNTAQSFSALQTFSGSSSTAAVALTNAKEVCTISATAATGTINYDVTTQSVLYYTSNASANWTVNFRGSSGTSLNSLMNTGETITIAFLVTQGSTAYYNNVIQIDGSAVTPKYQGGTAWSSGNTSSIDAYVYTIVKTGSAAFTVFASQTQFK